MALRAGRITAADLAARHGVSERTVRRFKTTAAGRAMIRDLDRRAKEARRAKQRRDRARLDSATRESIRADEREQPPDEEPARMGRPERGSIPRASLARLNPGAGIVTEREDAERLVPVPIRADIAGSKPGLVRLRRGGTTRWAESTSEAALLAAGWERL